MEATLQNIIQNTYNPSHDIRFHAENQLKEFLLAPGALTSVINLSGNSQDRNIRQVTAIILKNNIRNFLSDNANSPYKCSNEEKEYLNKNLIEILLIEKDSSIRKIFSEAIRITCQVQPYEKWSNLIPYILHNLQSGDVLKIINSLSALRKIVHIYEYKDKENRAILDTIAEHTFPILQQLNANLINNNSNEASEVMRISLKIFWSCTVYDLPKVNGVDVNFWFQFIVQILNKRLPEASEGIEPLGQPIEKSAREAWVWWRLKKWAGRIITHFIQRYGNPKYSKEENVQFAEYFRSNSAVMLCGAIMNVLHARSSGAFVTDNLVRNCLTFLSNCSEMSPTYKVMKPHLNFILFDVIFPTLCLSNEDIELFQEDPTEYIRKIQDPSTDFISPTTAASILLQNLCRYRQKDVMPLFLPFLQNILEEYTSAPPQSKDYRKKDGALVAISSLFKIMLDSKQYKHLLIPLLANHIFPEFTSNIDFLRARAFSTIEYFSGINWDDESHRTGKIAAKKSKKAKKPTGEISASEALKLVLHGLVNGLRDPSLPVQTAAACSLRVLIAEEGASELLKPLLPQIIGEYFRIMEEVENEAIISALQSIVEHYSDTIAPLAPEMVKHLIKFFRKYVADEEDEDSSFNAIQCIDTINTIIEQLGDKPEILIQMENEISPLFLYILNSNGNGFEYIDTIINMLSCYTYHCEQLTPVIWSFCGPVINALNEWAIDYILEMMPPILNYMTKGMNTFFQTNFNGVPVLNILLDAISKVYSNEEDGYTGSSINAASTLLICLFTNSKPFTNYQALIDQFNNSQSNKLSLFYPDNMAIYNTAKNEGGEELKLYHQANYKMSTISMNGLNATELIPILPQVYTLLFNRLQVSKHTSVKSHLLVAFLSTLYYNCEASLNVLKQLTLEGKFVDSNGNKINLSNYFFSLLFENLKNINSDFHLRLIVMSFMEIMMRVDEWAAKQLLPDVVMDNVASMFQQVIRELVVIEEELVKSAQNANKFEDEDDFDDDDEDFDEFDFDEGNFDESDAKRAEKARKKKLHVPEGGYDEDADCENFEDEEYRQFLESMSKEERVKREVYRAGGGDNDDFDDIIDDEDDGSYSSFLESVDVTAVLVAKFTELSNRVPQLSEMLKGALDNQDMQNMLQLSGKVFTRV